MTQTRSNELISNLELYNDGYTVHIKYTRNTDGKEMDDKIIPRFNGYDIESCKNLLTELKNLTQEHRKNRELNSSESKNQKFNRYVSETNAINQLLDSHQKVNSTLSKDNMRDKLLDHAEFLVTNYAVMSEFRKAKHEVYKYCDPSFKRTLPSKEDMNQLTQADLIDLINENERLNKQLLEKNKQLESQL